MSLKSILIKEIREKGQVSIDRIYQITDEMGHKRSNAERRLRASESPEIEAIYSGKGAIVAYRYIKKPEQKALFEEINHFQTI